MPRRAKALKFNSIEKMIRASVVNSRANCVPSAFGLGTGHVKHATRPARLPSPMFVAAVEEPQTSSDIDQEIDRDALYARFESLLGDYAVNLSQGDKVQGTIFRVDQKGAYVDVGGKSMAFCPSAELSMAKVARASDVLEPESVREFYVLRGERTGEPGLVLSLKRLEMEVAWARLRQYMEEDVTVRAKVASVNRGGILVDLENVRGFCPGSQLARRVQSFDDLLGQELDFKIMEVDEEKSRLMLSNKRAAAGEATNAFNVGDVVDGSVISVKPYGAFVDLGGGAAGLLHISQISHDRILNVDKVLSEGDKIKVMILSQDRERGRVALCTKKLEPNPGDMLRDPALVYSKAEEMAALFKERVAAAEAAAAAAAAGDGAAKEEASET